MKTRLCGHSHEVEGGQPYQAGQCRICWLWANRPGYREMCEGKTKGAFQKALSIGRAVLKHVVNHMENVPDEVYKERLGICEKCPLKYPNKLACRVCECNLVVKARWAAMECPEGKWGVYREGEEN